MVEKYLEITEEQKYRSKIMSFAGFALMTPLGHLFVDPFYINNFNKIGMIIYSLLCFSFFLAGFNLIEFGRGILYRRRKIYEYK